jgi:hypothetical protein
VHSITYFSNSSFYKVLLMSHSASVPLNSNTNFEVDRTVCQSEPQKELIYPSP